MMFHVPATDPGGICTLQVKVPFARVPLDGATARHARVGLKMEPDEARRFAVICVTPGLGSVAMTEMVTLSPAFTGLGVMVRAVTTGTVASTSATVTRV